MPYLVSLHDFFRELKVSERDVEALLGLQGSVQKMSLPLPVLLEDDTPPKLDQSMAVHAISYDLPSTDPCTMDPTAKEVTLLTVTLVVLNSPF